MAIAKIRNKGKTGNLGNIGNIWEIENKAKIEKIKNIWRIGNKGKIENIGNFGKIVRILQNLGNFVNSEIKINREYKEFN